MAIFGMPGDPFGGFQVPSCENGRMSKAVTRDLVIIASSGDPESGIYWEHVSVRAVQMANLHGRTAAVDQTPTWDEMCQVKNLFWGPEDVVMQLHPAKSNYVNKNQHVLHLWRPTREVIPLPPIELV